MVIGARLFLFFFFFNDPATTETYTLSLHDALPICVRSGSRSTRSFRRATSPSSAPPKRRSEEHTSELQSRGHLVCRLLLEKKKDTDCDSFGGQKKRTITDE